MDVKQIRRAVIDEHAVLRHELPRGATIHDYLDNALDASDSPHEAAAKIILHFGVEDGQYNNCRAAITFAFSFLFKCTGMKPTAVSASDLKRTLEDSPTLAALTGWARSHFQ